MAELCKRHLREITSLKDLTEFIEDHTTDNQPVAAFVVTQEGATGTLHCRTLGPDTMRYAVKDGEDVVYSGMFFWDKRDPNTVSVDSEARGAFPWKYADNNALVALPFLRSLLGPATVRIIGDRT